MLQGDGAIRNMASRCFTPGGSKSTQGAMRKPRPTLTVRCVGGADIVVGGTQIHKKKRGSRGPNFRGVSIAHRGVSIPHRVYPLTTKQL